MTHNKKRLKLTYFSSCHVTASKNSGVSPVRFKFQSVAVVCLGQRNFYTFVDFTPKIGLKVVADILRSSSLFFHTRWPVEVVKFL